MLFQRFSFTTSDPTCREHSKSLAVIWPSPSVSLHGGLSRRAIPDLVTQEMGKRFEFRSRCDYCHLMGGGAVSRWAANARRIDHVEHRLDLMLRRALRKVVAEVVGVDVPLAVVFDGLVGRRQEDVAEACRGPLALDCCNASQMTQGCFLLLPTSAVLSCATSMDTSPSVQGMAR